MADPVVHLTNGVPDSGTGNITTLGAVVAKQPALGTAGSASADVISVQGVASMTALKVDPSGVTSPVSLTSTTVTGTVAVTESGTWTVQPGNTPNTAPWLAKISDGTNAAAIKAASTAPIATDPALVVAISPNSINANGQVAKSASAPVVPASDWVYNKGTYIALPASTTTTIQSLTGAIGDYLGHIVVFPGTTAAGSIVIKDGATTIATYAGGGGTALLTLTPFTIYIGAVSTVGAWSAVVGGNVTGIAVGRFS